MEIQIPYNCSKYKQNDNLNKTCDNKARCKIYYDELCNEYKEKEDESNNSDDISNNFSTDSISNKTY